MNKDKDRAYFMKLKELRDQYFDGKLSLAELEAQLQQMVVHKVVVRRKNGQAVLFSEASTSPPRRPL